ncbi:Serine carboxypeptidase-like 46 [Glycine soja]
METILLLQLGIVHPSPSHHRITRLPGQPHVQFHQFSCYHALFYFAKAEKDALSKPLVLWLNGGPGCSSLGVGAFLENEPFRPKGEGLVRNQFSWKKEANYAGNTTIYLCFSFMKKLWLKYSYIYAIMFLSWLSLCSDSTKWRSICSSVMSQVSTKTSRFVEKYDVTLDVCLSSVFSQTKVLNPQERCAVSFACSSCWSPKMVYMQQSGDLEIPTITVMGKLVKEGIPENQ